MFKQFVSLVALTTILVVGTAHFLFWDGNPLLPGAFKQIVAAQTAQYDGTPIRISDGPNNLDYAKLIAYDGSGNIIYTGTAAKLQPAFAWTVSGGTLTSIVDATNTATVTTSTAHGLAVGNEVTIEGVLTDTDLNGVYYVQTVGSTTTFTITTASVTDTTYNAAGTILSTTAPRSTAAIWHITNYRVNGSNQTVGIANSIFSSIWDNRAVTTGTTKTTYN